MPVMASLLPRIQRMRSAGSETTLLSGEASLPGGAEVPLLGLHPMVITASYVRNCS